MSERFDRAYYDEWYRRRPVQTKAKIAALCDGTLSMAKWWGIPIGSVLDVGAGHGWWGAHLKATHPRVRYEGMDVSEYAARKHGFLHADIATWTPTRQYDLVVCQGTLHYLDDASCRRALRTLVTATRGLTLLEIPTSDDLDNGVIDASASHLDAHWRTASWYRRIMSPIAIELGCGLWVPKDSPHNFYTLERSANLPFDDHTDDTSLHEPSRGEPSDHCGAVGFRRCDPHVTV